MIHDHKLRTPPNTFADITRVLWFQDKSFVIVRSRSYTESLNNTHCQNNFLFVVLNHYISPLVLFEEAITLKYISEYDISIQIK